MINNAVWQFFRKNILEPGSRRLGSAAAAFLIFGGDWMCATFDMCGLVTQGGADMVVNYVLAVFFLALDVLMIWINNKKKGV